MAQANRIIICLAEKAPVQLQFIVFLRAILM